MQTKPLLYGLIGFFIGGFIVSVAATTFDKPEPSNSPNTSIVSTTDHNAQATSKLKELKGDVFDKAFIEEMIMHHQGAIDMAKLSAGNANHNEVKQLSSEIITAQEKEISQMKSWLADWGYSATPSHRQSEH